jgi:pimeloyl-ACP methyl ester carboxylesterase
MTSRQIGETSGSVQAPTRANVGMSEVPDDVEVVPVNLVSEDGLPSKGLFYKRRGTTPKTGVHLMHPRTDQSQNYNILPLVAAGYAVLGRAGRWPNNDVATVHEPLVLDVAAGVRFLHEQGCEKVVLLGNSGGGTMATYYQWQARVEAGTRLTHTPAGDPFDLNAYDVPAADGVVIIGGHLGEGALMAKLIDPAVIDEDDPLATDPELDLYDPVNGFRTPPESSKYSAEFLDRYHAAQLARAARLDAKARSLIQRQRDAQELLPGADGPTAMRLQRAARMGWFMIVYRTTADPAAVDLSIEPDDRVVQTYSAKRPDLENYSENGFSRYVTPRAWLSTWSPLSSRANTVENLAGIPDPLLIVHYAGDAGARLSEVAEMERRALSADKTLTIVRGADHYGFTIQPDGTAGPRSLEGTGAVVAWMRERFEA